MHIQILCNVKQGQVATLRQPSERDKLCYEHTDRLVTFNVNVPASLFR
jgi:hypothetical protein